MRLRRSLAGWGAGLLLGSMPALGRPALGEIASVQMVQAVRRPLDREVVITNHAKQPATEVYVSSADAPDWGDDRLAGGLVASGKSFRVKLGRGRDCIFDVQLVYQNGSREEQHGMDVCRSGQLSFDGTKAIEATGGEQHPVTLVNGHTRPIQQVYLSEAEAAQWGPDRADRSISIGGKLQFTFAGGCAVDLRVVFDNRAAEERRGLDICATPVLSIQPGWTTADTPPVPKAEPPRRAEAAAAAAPTTPGPSTARRSALRVVNGTGHDISQLYLYPEGKADQGQDLLGRALLRTGGTTELAFDAGDACRFSAHLVFTGQTPDRNVPALEVCTAPEVTLPP